MSCICESNLSMRCMFPSVVQAGGAILGASTAWGLCKISYYFWTTELGLEVGGGVVTVAAAVLCLPASWLATLVPYYPRAHVLHGAVRTLSR